MAIKTFKKASPTNYTIEIYNDFSGGINTELADNETRDNQFRKLINFDMDQAGALKKRPGLYRIPFVQKLIKDKLIELVKQGKIDTIVDLRIQDCLPFFDGLH